MRGQTAGFACGRRQLQLAVAFVVVFKVYHRKIYKSTDYMSIIFYYFDTFVFGG